MKIRWTLSYITERIRSDIARISQKEIKVNIVLEKVLCTDMYYRHTIVHSKAV